MSRIIWIIIASLICIGLSSTARANEWYVGGVLVSNVCTGNMTGAVWVYPVYQAQPVGSACRLPSGEFGTVG
jgi:hypothetical protein